MSRRNESFRSEVVRLVGGLIFLVAIVNFGPALLAAYTNTTAPAPAGTPWTLADANACHDVYNRVADWPGKEAALVTLVAGGARNDMASARALAVRSADKYLAYADTFPPGAESEWGTFIYQLTDFRLLSEHAATPAEFSVGYRKVRDSLTAILIRCDAVGRWVNQHVPQ